MKLNIKSGNSFIERNFYLYNQFLMNKHTSYSKGFIFIAISFIHIYLSQLQRFHHLVDYHYSLEPLQNYVDTLLLASEYINVLGVISLSETIYYVFFAIAQIFTLGNFMLYLLILALITKTKNTKFKPRKKLIGQVRCLSCILLQLFIFISEYYLWILYFTSFTTLLSYLECETILTINCDFTTNRIIGFIFALLGTSLIFGFLNIIFLSIFFQNTSDNKKDAFNCENPTFLLIFNLFRTLLAFFIVFNSHNYAYLWVFLIFTFCFSLYFVIAVLLDDGFLAFQTQFIRRVFLIFCTAYLSEIIAMIVDEVLRLLNFSGKPTIDNIFLYYLLLLAFLEFVILNNLQTSNIQNQINIQIGRISGKGLKKQVFMLETILEQSSSTIEQDVYFKGVLQRHIDKECCHPIVINILFNLYLSQEVIKDVFVERGEYLIQRKLKMPVLINGFLIKRYFWIETYNLQNQNDKQIKILFAQFMFGKLRNHQVSLKILLEVEKNFLFIPDRYRAYQLKQKIIKYIQRRNKESYKGKLEVEKALEVEENIDLIKRNIFQILDDNCHFWSLLSRNTINLLELNNLLKNQFFQINRTKEMWVQINQYLDFKKKWKFYYSWFSLYLLNKKIKARMMDNFQGSSVNDNDIFSEEIQENDMENDVVSIKSFDQDDIQEKIEIKNRKIVFDRKSCIIHTNDEPNALILNVNKQFTKIFGYQRDEVVLKMAVNALMPDIFSKHHPLILEDYQTTGRTSALYSQKKIFCLHKDGYIFTAWKFLKLFVGMNGESQYVAMIKPINQNNEKKEDYIIFDQDWEVCGFTQNLKTTFSLDQTYFTKRGQTQILINLLLFAPKLIQYSKIAKNLKEGDFNLFGLLANKKLRNTKSIKSDKSRDLTSPTQDLTKINSFFVSQQYISLQNQNSSLNVPSSQTGLIQNQSMSNFQEIELHTPIIRQESDQKSEEKELSEYKKEVAFMAAELGLLFICFTVNWQQLMKCKNLLFRRFNMKQIRIRIYTMNPSTKKVQ